MSKQKLDNDGVEKAFVEIEWQNIYFDKLNIELSSNKLPTSNFYDKFYKELFKKYQNFESLPKNWLTIKEDTARSISELIYNNQKILSYGCGIGYIEKILITLNPTLKVFAYDFADYVYKWLDTSLLNKITYKRNLDVDEKFDFIYLCQVLYALSYTDCVKLIKRLSNHLNYNGKILLINTSIIPSENGEIRTMQYQKSYLKNIILQFYRKIFQASKKHKEQLWGWNRDNKKYLEISTSANMKVCKCYSASKQSFILLSNLN